MPTLIVANVCRVNINGLGTRVPLHNLSQKRITKAVREELRNIYGRNNVTVSCSAQYTNNNWVGTCIINQTVYNYQII